MSFPFDAETDWDLVGDVVKRGREEFGKNEDHWLEEELSTARKWLPARFGTWSLHDLHEKLIRWRKDKRDPKPVTPESLVDRLNRAARDFRRSQERNPQLHSDEYRTYVDEQSTEWRLKARLHKERCNYRCQLCGRETHELDVHHTSEGYAHLGFEQPWHLLAVCRMPCHAIADMLRSSKAAELEEYQLFD